MEDHLVAPAGGDHLPVAPPQRLLGPPAILDQPRLPHRVHLALVDLERAPTITGGHRHPARHAQTARTGHQSDLETGGAVVMARRRMSGQSISSRRAPGPLAARGSASPDRPPARATPPRARRPPGPGGLPRAGAPSARRRGPPAADVGLRPADRSA